MPFRLFKKRRKAESAKEEKAEEKAAEDVAENVKKFSVLALIGIILGIMFTIILFTILGIKVNFIVGDELQIDLRPLDKSIIAHYNETKNVTFDFNNNNVLFCRSVCDYSLTDTRNGNIISEKNRTLKHNEMVEESYYINAGTVGSGQVIYNFQLECNNVKSLLCPTDGSKRYKSSVITLNYDLSDAEKAEEKILRENLTAYFELLSNADIARQQNTLLASGFEPIAQRAGISEIAQILSGNSLLENDFYSRQRDAKAMLKLWSGIKYSELSSQLPAKSGSATILFSQIKNQTEFITSAINEHNSLIMSSNKLASTAGNFGSLVDYYNSTGQGDSIQSVQAQAGMINEFLSSVESARYYSYEHENNAIGELNKNIGVLNARQSDNLITLAINGSYYAYLTDKMLEQYGYTQNSDASGTAQNSLNSIHDAPENIDTVKSACAYIKNQNSTIAKINSDAESLRNKKYSALENNAQFKDMLNVLEEKALADAKNKIIVEIKAINAEKNDTAWEQISILADYQLSSIVVPINESIITNISDLPMIAPAQLPPEAEKYYSKYCAGISGEYHANITFSFNNDTELTRKIANETAENITTIIDTNVPANLPQCCVFGQCKTCCTYETCADNEKQYPIIFIHGHAFNKDNSPESSMDSFAKIQRQLESDGYVNAGQIDMTTDPNETSYGEWGRSGWPVTVRASYYYISYINLGSYSVSTQKSESIENYAIRLKEIIDLVKYRTGMKKVNIVAHSMGGLVARDYISLFGEDNVNRLIMVATPNDGITGNIPRLCSLFGNSVECSDMTQGSIFLNKLNSPLNIPKTARFYTITAVGCDMGGENGDGIALAKNTLLDYAENFTISGKCTDALNSNLHTEILNSDTYPEITTTIEKIMKE